jgi:O-acetyl-ADP-ribose deacetylase (regulator of RNase III)
MLTFKWIVGDITKDEVDVIVNAANSGLLGGGGVDGAIHKAAGPRLKKECLSLRNSAEFHNGLPTGQVVATWAYSLPAQMVFHTVGPIYNPEEQQKQGNELINCYVNCIQRALDWNLKSIAFPAISTGAYGFPKALAASAARVATVIMFDGEEKDLEVRFYFTSQEDREIHQMEFFRHEKKEDVFLKHRHEY